MLEKNSNVIFVEGDMIEQRTSDYEWVPIIEFLNCSLKYTDTNQFIALMSTEKNEAFDYWIKRLSYLKVPYILAKGTMKEERIETYKGRKINKKALEKLKDGRVKRYKIPKKLVFGLFTKPFV